MADLTLSEAAAALDVDSSTLRHQITNGRLKARKVGPIWVVSEAELRRYRAQSLGKPGQYDRRRRRRAAPAES